MFLTGDGPAIKRPEDKGLVKKIESERGRELFQKLSASLRDLKAKWKQHKESIQANQELIEALKIQVDGLPISVSNVRQDCDSRGRERCRIDSDTLGKGKAC